MFSLPPLSRRSVEPLAARAWARRLYPELGVADPVAEGLWAALGAPRVKASRALRALCEGEAMLERQVTAFWARNPRGKLLELGAGLSTRLLSLARHRLARERGERGLIAVDAPARSRMRAWLFSTDLVAEREFTDPASFAVPEGEFLVLLATALEPWHRRFLREVLPRFEAASTVPVMLVRPSR